VSELRKRAASKNAKRGWTQKRRQDMARLHTKHGYFSKILLPEDEEVYAEIREGLVQMFGKEEITPEVMLVVHQLASHVFKHLRLEEIYSEVVRDKRKRGKLSSERTTKQLAELHKHQRDIENQMERLFNRLRGLKGDDRFSGTITLESIGFHMILPFPGNVAGSLTEGET